MNWWLGWLGIFAFLYFMDRAGEEVAASAHWFWVVVALFGGFGMVPYAVWKSWRRP